MQSAHIHGLLIEFIVREGRADADLDVLSGALTHHHVVNLLEIHPDRITDLITGDPHRFTQDRATKTQHGHLGGATTDINNHRSNRFGDGKAGADRRSDRLIDEMHLAGPSHPGLADRPPLDTGDAAGNADHQAGSHDSAPFVPLVDEGFQHLFRGIEIGDDAVPQRAHGPDVARSATEHQLRFIPHGQGGAALQIQSDHGGLLKNNAAAGDVDQGVGSPQIDADVS